MPISISLDGTITSPIIDYEPVRHGHWEEFHCSVCGEMGWDNEDKYCPNCGAKMDESTMGQEKSSDGERKKDETD